MNTREFETWVRRLRPSLQAVARRMLADEDDAEDAVQDALLKLWLVRDRLTLYRSPDALAVVVVKNLCISRWRERQAEALPLPENVDIRSERSPDWEMEEREDHTWLCRTIQGLPSAQMTILKMSQAEGMSNRQIADVLGITETSVRTALCKARHKLLEELKKRK
ncbi:MAG: sigma-70 family RNA polymerase sigma factor [Bacteroidaceae bacterium]|nr:sigma-70 family RNA polymerase sigma factor [Bacteroidaceae bacterium]